ncbi:MAG: SDR family NAD(P)-dependent oxidoreductase [Deltaproteobacteria bacterium]|nr:SDR family NAD(P)-dependent oxidoreductase [Deltaproteobacteria bacterium]
MKIAGSVAVVTGGASGLGEACVSELVSSGARVAILDLAEKKAETVPPGFWEHVIFYKTDVTDEMSVQEAIDGAMQSFGAIHVLINCAGVGTPAKVLGKKGPMPMDGFNKVVQINLIGTVNMIRLTAEKMVQNPGNEDGEKGVIINTASVAAFEGQIGQAAYAASKAAVVGLTLPVAREFADYGLRIVTIAPGLFDTPMARSLPEKVRETLAAAVPFPRRFGKPTEFAMLAKHIIENASINGTTIRIDGAIRMGAK